MQEKDLTTWLQKYGDLQEAQAITYTPPRPAVSEEEQAILQKMQDLAAQAGEQLHLSEQEQEQEPVRSTTVYDLFSSDTSLPEQAKAMANTYLKQHIDTLRSKQGIPDKNKFVEVVPGEEVIVILENRSELTPPRRHGMDVVFQHKKEIVGPHHLQEPKEVGIHSRRVNLVLRVDSGSAEPLPEWFPRVFPQATVVNVRRSSQLEGQ